MDNIIYLVYGTYLDILYELFHLNTKTTLKDRYDNSHLTDEKTDSEKKLAPNGTAANYLSCMMFSPLYQSAHATEEGIMPQIKSE